MQSSGTAARKSIAPQKDGRLFTLKRNIPYLLMMLIPSALLLVFNYWPMIGLSMAFQNYRTGAPFLSASTQWVGMKWFETFLHNPMAGRLIRNTLLLNVYSILVSFPACIMLALTLNELRSRKLKKFATNVSMLPYFISTVVVVGIMVNFLSVDNGIINNLIASLGGAKKDFMGSTKWFRTLYVLSGVWQGTGFSAMIYTAAIAGIDPTLYEAAAIDGCSRFKCMYKITIPCIMPTIMIMLILSIGGLFSSGVDKILLMYSPAIYETADTLGTYTYRAGVIDGKISLSTAVGLSNGVCNVILLVLANWGSRKATESSLF